MAFGFGLGPLVGGVMGQWAPWPLVTTYIPTLILGALGLVVLLRLNLPPAAQKQHKDALRIHDVLPKLTWPERSASSAFVLVCALPFLAFGVFGLYAAMSPCFWTSWCHGMGQWSAARRLLSSCLHRPRYKCWQAACLPSGAVLVVLSVWR